MEDSNKTKKILIVDDAEFMRQVIRGVVEPEGYNIIEAQDGKEALEKINTENPDLVLLDIIMPEVDGIGVLKEIAGKTNVIVVSAVGQEAMINEAKRLGALDYIVKPFDAEEDKDKILQSIKKALG